MDLSLKQVSVYRVRGRVLNQVTRKTGRDIELQLLPRGMSLEWEFGPQSEVKKADGSFEIAYVVPGSYLLLAYWVDGSKVYSSQEKVDVVESDVEGMTLTLGAGATISGRIRWEGKPSLKRDELQIYLQSTFGAFFGGSSARAQANLQFALTDVNEGEYRVIANGLSEDCYVKEIEYGETRSKDDTIAVSKGAGSQLELTISSRGARVQGVVADSDGLPAAGVWVVAVPDQARRGNSRLFKSQTTDQYGKYDLRGLAPGSYKIFAWNGIEQGEWEDPEFLKMQEAKGESVDVADEDVKTVNSKLIEKKSNAGE
jgi:hypothetical protein